LRTREDWHAFEARLALGGVASELARNCELHAWDGQRLVLTLDPASERLRVDAAEQRLRESLTRELGEGTKLEIRVSRPTGETPSQRRVREQGERQTAAEAAMETDPVIGILRSELGARFVPGTVVPTETPPPAGGEHR
jgi:DNA polymerase-3 subunit gamma/tau